MKRIFTSLIALFWVIDLWSQSYSQTFDIFEKTLNDNLPISFKKAVFLVENTFNNGNINESDINTDIAFILNLTKIGQSALVLNRYNGKDSFLIKKYASIFKIFTDSTIVVSNGDSALFTPFSYNFDDMFGEKDWSNMFVTKLLATHKGNCHSMPYLYKILCDELGIPCHLALAPNHIYIKHRSEKVGWYNTELTSASFPIDAWIMASGYISLESIQNGIYMEALDDKKCITLCVYDLAKGYDRKYPDNDGRFIVNCCDLALEHFPNFINALILKAETRKKQFERLAKEHSLSFSELKQRKDGQALWNDMTQLYNQIYKLGYRSMPEKMYVDWLTSLKKECDKYNNKQVPGMDKN